MRKSHKIRIVEDKWGFKIFTKISALKTFFYPNLLCLKSLGNTLFLFLRQRNKNYFKNRVFIIGDYRFFVLVIRKGFCAQIESANPTVRKNSAI